jgi:hypothetical protein
VASLILSAVLVMGLSLGLGAALTAAARRGARARGQEELLAKLTFTGTPEQRRRTLIFAAVLSGLAALALTLGAGAGLVGILVVLSLAMAGQAAVLEAAARLRRAPAGAEPAAR